MKVELTRFRVKPGMSQRVDEWMKMLRDNLPAVLKTLVAEEMYVESIFRETLNGEEYLYWYTVQGEQGQSVEKSEHEVDKLHLQFWKECIDPTFRGVDLNNELTLLSEGVQKAIGN